MNSFYEEEKILLNDYLSRAVFKPSYTFEAMVRDLESSSMSDSLDMNGIELIVRPECNQKCEYCYIARYGKELYPIAERGTKEQLIHNIDLLLDYVFIQQKSYVNHWELFAGDLFYDDLYFDIIDIFEKYLSKIKKLYPTVLVAHSGLILAPTNFSFLHDDQKASRVKEYIKHFETEYNWELGFSISTDGKYATATREGVDLPDEWFDKLFQWSIEYPRNGFHTILSVSNIDTAVQNYEWWKEKCKKWHVDTKVKPESFLPYYLEARNDEWDTESIEKVMKFLNYMVNDRLIMCNNDVDKLAYHLFKGDSVNNTLPALNYSDLISISSAGADIISKAPCSLSGLTCIQISNLSLVPCHRLAYHQFRGGIFKTNDDNTKIVDLQPYNVTGYIAAKTFDVHTSPKCANCVYTSLCKHGCCGAQFEASGELFLPIRSVCELEKHMITFLIRKYDTIGVLESAQRQDILPHHLPVVFKEIYNLIGEEGLNYYDKFIS